MSNSKIKYEGFFRLNVSENLIRNTKISLQAKGLYMILLSFCDKNYCAFPSIELLKKLSGLSNSTLIKFINELEKFGLLEKQKERTRTGEFKRNVYKLYDYDIKIHFQNLEMEKQAKHHFHFIDTVN
jgi:predicted transcriptional regulator